MEELQIFNNPDFGNIRALEINGEPFFVGRDIAEALGYTNPRKAIIDHVEDDDKGVTKCDTLGGSRLWTWMRDNGYIFKHSCEPTQKSMEMGLFEVIERTIQRSNHAPKVTRTTKVTGKGQIYFLNKIVKQKEAES